MFGLKSVQLPALPVEIKVKQGISDAYYFRRIADELVRRKENKGVDRNVHVLLAEGFYNLPLWVDAECYSRNARLNVLSQKPVKYFLDEDLSAGRNMQNVPAAPSSEKNDKGEDESIVPEAGVVSAEPAEKFAAKPEKFRLFAWRRNRADMIRLPCHSGKDFGRFPQKYVAPAGGRAIHTEKGRISDDREENRGAGRR